VFLSPFAPQRLLSSDHYREPTPDCPVCSPAQTRILVDLNSTTLGDVVEGLLRSQFGYGEEFTVNNEVGTLYDVDETENLAKKLADLGEPMHSSCYDIVANYELQASRTAVF